MPIYRYNGKILYRHGGIAFHERCCCDAPCCCKNFAAPMCVDNNIGAAPNKYFAEAGVWEYKITQCNGTFNGSCDVVFDLDIEVKNTMTLATCNTTATLTLNTDCDCENADDLYYDLVFEACESLSGFPLGPETIGDGCTGFDLDGACGSAVGGGFDSISGDLVNPNGVVVIDCGCPDSNDDGGDDGGGGGGGGDDGGGGEPGGGDPGDGGNEGFP